jgi:hypothetical protein
MQFQIVARGRSSTSDNHCAIVRSVDVQRHGVNQFLASRNIHGTFKPTGLRYSVKAILVIALWVRPMWLAAFMRCTQNCALVDRVDFATLLSMSSRSVTGLSALAPAQRAGAQRLCALARVDRSLDAALCPEWGQSRSAGRKLEATLLTLSRVRQEAGKE